MANKYVVLVNFTDQGVKTITESVKRASDAAAMRGLLAIGRVGNVRTTTLRAFNAEEMEAVTRGL